MTTEVQWAAKMQRVKALVEVMPRLDEDLAEDFRHPAAAALIVMSRLGLPSADLCVGVVRVTAKRVYFGSLAGGAEFFCDDPLVVAAVTFHASGKRWQSPLFGVTRADMLTYLRQRTGASFTLKDVRTAWASGYAKLLVDQSGRKAAARKPHRIDVAALRRALVGLLESMRAGGALSIGADGLAIREAEPDDPEDAW